MVTTESDDEHEEPTSGAASPTSESAPVAAGGKAGKGGSGKPSKRAKFRAKLKVARRQPSVIVVRTSSVRLHSWSRNKHRLGACAALSFVHRPSVRPSMFKRVFSKVTVSSFAVFLS